MSCGWKEGLGWGEEVSEKGSVNRLEFALVGYMFCEMLRLYFHRKKKHYNTPLMYLQKKGGNDKYNKNKVWLHIDVFVITDSPHTNVYFYCAIF